MEVQEGALIPFQAWLAHEVRMSAGSGERITIAFNLMLTDYSRTVSPPIWKPTGAPKT